MKTAPLGLWESLSHTALLCLIVVVLKSHSALLCLIVFVLKVVAAKTNWRKKIWNTRLEVQVFCPTKSATLK